jgi:hypothetical protein
LETLEALCALETLITLVSLMTLVSLISYKALIALRSLYSLVSLEALWTICVEHEPICSVIHIRNHAARCERYGICDVSTCIEGTVL